MRSLLQDLRFAVRMLAKSPGFTAVAVFTLALGIGANTAVFSVLYAALLRPLPYSAPGRLVYFSWQWPQNSIGALSPLQYSYWQEHSTSFEAVSAYQEPSFNLATGEQAEYVRGLAVSHDFFQVLRVTPVLGRTFLLEEDRPGGPPVAVISHDVWRRRFGSNPDVVSQASPTVPATKMSITLNGQPHTVVGVLPATFVFRENPAAAVWVPLRLRVNPRDTGHNYNVIARLKSGVTLEQAQADVGRTLPQFRRDFPDHDRSAGERGILLTRYGEWLARHARAPLRLLFLAAAVVLLIAAVNVANLLLSRSAAREREMAIRLALGADAFRVFRLLATESLLLALAGGCVGVLLAGWTREALVALTPRELFQLSDVRLDAPVLGFALLITFVVGIGAAVAPTMRVQRASASRFGRIKLRNVLVAGEAALCMVLLSAAMLLTVSLFNLMSVPPGFDPDRLWTFRTFLPPQRYKTTSQVQDFERQVTARLAAKPGVTAVATASNLPLEWGYNFGVQVRSGGETRKIYIQARIVSPNYFQTLGIPILRGRPFLESDSPTSPPVIIVNETLARRCCKGGGATGAQINTWDKVHEVVGVVADIKERALDADSAPTIFIPRSQAVDQQTRAVNSAFLAAWIVKTGVPLRFEEIQRLVAEVDSAQPVIHLRSMERVIADSASVFQKRFVSLLLSVFAGLALLLAAAGIYGVVSYSVSRRVQEIGVRMALGAQSRDVLKMVVGEGMRHVLVGAAFGVVAALMLTRLLRSMLFGIEPHDPATFIGGILILAAVALLASYIPARRAAKVDPMVALRYE